MGSLAPYEFTDGTPRLKEVREKNGVARHYVEPKEVAANLL